MNAVAERRADPVMVFRQAISTPAMREQLKMALPSHISVERFERVCTTAVQTNPDLLDPQKVNRHSLFGAMVRAAQDGLLPDGREGAIIPFKGKAQWMPMIAGIMKKVRQSGEIATWDAFAVYEKDKFQRLLGDDMRLYHEPYEEGDPGQVVGAYSIVTFKDGSKSKDYMPRWRIEKAREQNPIGKNSLMWTKFYDEGAIKTVVRHHSKRLPMSTDIEAFFERDETIEPSRQPQREIAEDQIPPSRLDALEHRLADEAEEDRPSPAETLAPEAAVGSAAEGATSDEQYGASDYQEGRAGSDMGDGFIDQPHPAEAAANRLLQRVRQCEFIGDLNVLLNDAKDEVAAYPEEIAETFWSVANKKRAALKGKSNG